MTALDLNISYKVKFRMRAKHLHLSNRFSECSMYRPSSQQSSFHSMMGHIYFFYPLSKALYLSIVFYQSIISFISTLFLGCSPTAIPRSIISIVINSINRIFWRRFFTHILKEVSKRITPAVTYLYSASPVITVSCAFLVIASLFHVNPRQIFWCSPLSMLEQSLRRFLTFETTTRFCSLINNITVINYCCVSTVTLAFIFYRMINIPNTFNDNQFMKSFSSEIIFKYHDVAPKKVSPVRSCHGRKHKVCLPGQYLYDIGRRLRGYYFQLKSFCVSIVDAVNIRKKINKLNRDFACAS